jgi:hypothetical protein
LDQLGKGLDVNRMNGKFLFRKFLTNFSRNFCPEFALKIRPEKENKESGQKNKRNQKNNLAKNFLLTNFNLIAKNNLNI